MSHYGAVGPRAIGGDENVTGTTTNDPAANTFTAKVVQLDYASGPFSVVKNTGGSNTIKYVLTGYHDPDELSATVIQSSQTVAPGAVHVVQITTRYHHVKWEIDANVDGNQSTFMVNLLGLSLTGKGVNMTQV